MYHVRNHITLPYQPWININIPAIHTAMLDLDRSAAATDRRLLAFSKWMIEVVVEKGIMNNKT